MIVYKLTSEQAEILANKECDKGVKFNPTLDADGNYFISIEEIEGCTNRAFAWIKDLEPIEHKPKTINFNFKNKTTWI